MIKLLRLNALCLATVLTATAAGPSLSEHGLETRAPIKKFSTPMFTPEGVRTMILRGEEARILSEEQIDMVGMHLTLFNQHQPAVVDTNLTAAKARFFTKQMVADGAEGFELVRDDVTMSGQRWHYTHRVEGTDRKKVVIEGKVRVTFKGQVGNILQ